MLRRGDKKGLSTIVATLLIILLVLVAVAIVWLVVKNVLQGGAEQVSLGKFTLNLEITQVQRLNDSALNVIIKRNNGEGDFVGINFIVDDGNKTEVIKKIVSLKELETRRFELDLTEINASEIKKISIIPIFKLESGKEVNGIVKDEYEIGKGKGSGGTTCTPSCPPGAECGSDGCGGTCGGGCPQQDYVCSNYQCIEQHVCTDTCTSLGYTCGTHTVCGDNVDCGICRIGYECSLGNCTALCDLTSANWNTTSVITGQIVRLNIEGTNCESKTIMFEIKEKDGLFNENDNVTNNPLNITFTGTSPYGLWAAEYQDDTDGLLQTNPPEYYFIATLSGTTEFIESSNAGGSDLLLLIVNQAVSCGDGQCNGAETCSTCLEDCGCSSGYSCSLGLCVCTSHSSTSCYDNDVYWFNGCGTREDKNKECSDGDGCTTDVCQTGSCNNLPYGCINGDGCCPSGCNMGNDNDCTICTTNTQCEDNNACTTNICSGGTCTYPSIICNDNNICTTDTCNLASGCIYTPKASGTSCTDSNLCTTDSCSVNGTCMHTSIICNDNNICTSDSCNLGSGCVYTGLTGTSCSYDSDLCTADVCQSGSCAGVPISNCCGNSIIEGIEQCDKTALGGATCASRLGTGYTGVLNCSSSCTFDTNLCIAPCTNTCATFNYQCGTHAICGINTNCGTCNTGYSCQTNGTCIKNPCTDTCSSLGFSCGTRTICGANVNCGTCATGYSCQTNGTCIKDCVPTTCTALGKNCGSWSNGCTGTLNCGTCSTGYTCQTNGTCISIGSGHIYYVATNGSDSNPGTITQPWKTWSKGFSAAKVGDTVYFRGGVYYSTSDVGGERGMSSGTAENPIRFFAYPGETPILDCSSHNTAGYGYHRGISMWHVQYIHMKGLHIRNVYQGHKDVNVVGIDAWDSGNLIFEEMVLYNIDGEGLVLSDYNGDVLVKNCDVYNLNDALRTAVYPTPGSPGQDGSAFQITNEGTNGQEARDSRIYFEGCRAWNFSDNGFAGPSIGYVEFKNCWAFDGGMLSGEGCGFKYASTYGGDNNTLPLARIVNNCISAMNGAYGFSPNNDGDLPLNGHYYNNFAYHNGYKDTGHGWGHGFALLNYAGNKPLANEMYSNNIAYDNEYGEVSDVDIAYIHDHNSWDSSVTVNNADFVSLDVNQLKAPRKADGSLPDITFGHLVAGSDLIDKGVNVGLPYSGSAPDLGAFESNY